MSFWSFGVFGSRCAGAEFWQWVCRVVLVQHSGNGRTVAGDISGTDPTDMIQARVGHYVCNLLWDYYEIQVTKNGYGSLDNASRSGWTDRKSVV